MTERNSRQFQPGRSEQSAGRRFGLLEWLRPGKYDHAEETLQLLRELKAERLRTGLPWADQHLLDQETARFSPVSVTKGGLPNVNIR